MLKSNFVHSSSKKSSGYINIKNAFSGIDTGVVILNLKSSEPDVYMSIDGYDQHRAPFSGIEKTKILSNVFFSSNQYSFCTVQEYCEKEFVKFQRQYEEQKGQCGNVQSKNESQDYHTITQYYVSKYDSATKYSARPGYGFLLKCDANVNAWWTIESVESLKSMESDLMLACSCDNYSDCIAVWSKLKNLTCFDIVLIHQVDDSVILNQMTSNVSRDKNLTVRFCVIDPVEFVRKLAKKAKIELDEVEIKDNSETNEDSKILLKTSDERLTQILR
jgi:hypothetical protein